MRSVIPPSHTHRMKRCKKCGVIKPLSDFYREKGCRDGHRPECKDCNLAAKKIWYDKNREKAIACATAWAKANPERVRATRRARYQIIKEKVREQHLVRTFGMTLAEYEAMLAAQGGVCAICGEAPRPDESFHVDHLGDVIRGILCVRCNNALGQLREDVAIAERAVDYLASGGFVPSGAYEERETAIARAGLLVKAPG